MSMAYETGPVHCYYGSGLTPLTLPSLSTAYYLGTGEIAPDIIKQVKYDPVFNDIAGSLPYDYLFQGAEAIVPFNFTVFNWTRMQNIDTAPGGSSPGFYAASGEGTLMATEGYTFHLYLHFPYYSYKPIFSSAGMPNGYHFWGAIVDSVVPQPGTKANKVRVNFRCMRIYQAASTGNGFYLYDHSMALSNGTIPVVPPTAQTGALV